MIDGHGRTIDYLRLSITDRCNLRCLYCMPSEGVAEALHEDILRFEEILRLVQVLANLGIRHVRVTGGEPTVRRGYIDLISALHELDGIASVSMTSNGILLADMIPELKAAGLDALNLSIDTVNPAAYARITRGGDVNKVLRTLHGSLEAGIPVKLNAVPLRGFNEDSLIELAAFAKEKPISVRFIELMPIGCGQEFCPIPEDEVKQLLEKAYGKLYPESSVYGRGPASYCRPEGFSGTLGFISAVSHEFCGLCNRIRLTADGQLKLCLNHSAKLDLREMLRTGATDAELTAAIQAAAPHKPARHEFNQYISDREGRRMNEIGG
ncbi:MAG: GTP 3',8-cyclase MoaA [bacterium]|nr:GTP 3',8-cyclase MoaA [bacterium]